MILIILKYNSKADNRLNANNKEIIMVRMVAVDLDGTLMNSRGEMPSDFQDWVLAHPDIMTVIASGRQYYTLQDVFSKKILQK